MSGDVNVKITATDEASEKFRALSGEAVKFGAVVGAASKATEMLVDTLSRVTIGGLKQAVDEADKLYDLSQKLGMGVSQLATYKLAAEQSGSSLEGVAQGIKSLSGQMLKHGEAFKKIGIDTKDSDKAFRQLADIFSAMPDGMDKAALSVKLFGRAGMDLIPVLNLGSKGLDEATEKSRKYAEAMKALAPEADKLKDTYLELQVNTQAAFANMALMIVPSLTEITKAMAEAGKTGTIASVGMAGLEQSLVEFLQKADPNSFDPLIEALRAIAVLGLNVSYVLKQTGNEIGGLAAQIVALGTLDLNAFSAIGKMMEEDAENARKEFDKVEQRLMSLNKLTKAKSLPKDYRDARDRSGEAEELAKAIRQADELRKIYESKGKQIKAAVDEYEKLINRLFAKDVGLDSSYWKDLETLHQQYLKTGDIDAYREAVGKLTTQQKFYVDAQKASATAQEAFNQHLTKEREVRAKAGQDVLDKAIAMERELENYGLLESAIYDKTIADLEEARILAMKEQDDQSVIDSLDKQIDGYKRLAEAKRGIEAKDTAKKAAEDSSKAWEKFSDDIERSLTDALMRGFESGKGFGESFVDSLKNTLKTAALKIVVQAIVDPITGKGGLLQSGISSLTGGAGSSFSTAGNAASSANSLVNGYNTFFSGSTTLSGASASSIASGSAYGTGFMTEQSLMLAAQETGLTAASSVMAAVPYVAAGIAAVQILSGMSHGGTPHAGGIAFGSANGYTSPDSVQGIKDEISNAPVKVGDYTTSQVNFLETDWLTRESKQVSDSLGQYAQAMSSTLNQITARYGAGTGYEVGVAYSADGEDGSRGRFGIIKDDTILSGSRQRYDSEMQQGMTEFLADIPSELLQSMRSLDLSPVVDAYLDKSQTATADMLEGMGDAQANAIVASLNSDWLGPFLENLDSVGMTFEEVTAAITSFAKVATLKPVFDALGLDIYEMGNTLAAAFGGVQNAGAALGSFYDQFYTDAEKLDALTAQVTAPFDAVAQSVPQTREEFRALVESLDLTSQAGVDAYRTLLNLAPAFVAVADAAEAAAAAADAAANRIAGERDGLMEQLYTLQGDGAALREMQILGLDAANQGLQRYIWSLEDAATAADLAAAANEQAIEEARLFSETATQFVRDAIAALQAGAHANADSAYGKLADATGREQAAIRAGAAAAIDALDSQSQTWADTVSAADDAANALKSTIDSLSNALTSATEDLRTSIMSPAQTVAQGRSQIDAMLQAAWGGALPDEDALSSALSAVTGDTTAGYATALDYQRAQAVQAGKLDTLNDLIKRQGSTEDASVTYARRQLETLEDQRKLIEDAADAQIGALEAQLDYAKLQLDATLGLDTRMMSVATALGELGTALGVLKQTGTTESDIYKSAAGATYAKSSDTWTALDGTTMATPDLKALAYSTAYTYGARALYDGALAAGVSLSDLEMITGVPTGSFESWARKNNLLVFAKGTNYIPRDTLAMVHEGERIIPAADNSALMRRLDSGSNVIDIQPLLAELQAMRAELAEIKRHTGNTSGVLDGSRPQGRPLLTEAA